MEMMLASAEAFSEGGCTAAVPAAGTMKYVYILQNTSDLECHYVGCTADLECRIADHNAGLSPHTSNTHRRHY